MREILFRGKRLQGGHWVEGYFFKSDINYRERTSGKASLIFTPDCDTFIMIPETHNSVMVHADTVGQYTGLTDKNGERIWEGDIVRYGSAIHHVVFEHRAGNTYFGIVIDEQETWGFCPSVPSNQMEVIGNIHDNPGLMEGE